MKMITAIINPIRVYDLRSTKVGDGKIFITDLKSAVRIRTGEKDNSTL